MHQWFLSQVKIKNYMQPSTSEGESKLNEYNMVSICDRLFSTDDHIVSWFTWSMLTSEIQ